MSFHKKNITLTDTNNNECDDDDNNTKRLFPGPSSAPSAQEPGSVPSGGAIVNYARSSRSVGERPSTPGRQTLRVVCSKAHCGHENARTWCD